MNKLFFYFVCLPFISLSQSQTEGIKFESGLSWNQVKEKAKREDKMIFMDCFATWCAPCKVMDKNIFPNERVGSFFNKHFICVKTQMDQTSSDVSNIKEWYEDALTMKAKYSIDSYPTYLFFSPEGFLVHREVGSVENADHFIGYATNALDPAKQYYTLIAGEKVIKNDTVLLLRALKNAIALSDAHNSFVFGNDYLSIANNSLSKRNIELFGRVVQMNNYYSNPCFQFILNNARQIDLIMQDTAYVENLISSTLFDHDVNPVFAINDGPIYWQFISYNLTRKYPQLDIKFIKLSEKEFQSNIDFEISLLRKLFDTTANWKKLSNLIKIRFPDYETDRLILKQEVEFFAHEKSWNQCATVSFDYLSKYGNQIYSQDLNNICWYYLFLHSDNKKILLEGAKWMRTAIDKGGASIDCRNLDTYANLLYKSGLVKEALKWERNALESASNANLKPEVVQMFRDTVEKMNSGEPTWPTGI